jgi:sporulation protein YlmC with PRC-barrel domain
LIPQKEDKKMGTTKIGTKEVLAVGLIVLLSGYGWAVGQESSTFADSDAATLHEPGTMTAGEATLVRASRVMHAQVKSKDGMALGRVDDLVLTPDLNGISYVALSSGGIVGLGSTLHAVPWSAMSAGLNGRYVVPVTKEQLRQMPGFRAGYWPSNADTCWTITGAGTVPPALNKEEAKAVRGRRFSNIKGFLVRDAKGTYLGTIRDMVIVRDDGRVAYTIVSHGGLFGFGARYSAVPESAIQIEPDRRMARLDVAPSVLQANSFSPSRWPALSDPAYAGQLAQAFGVPTSEMALGYVAPAPSPTTPTTPQPAPTPTPPPATSTAPSPMMAEPSAQDLAGTFNPASISTVEGTVVAQGKFTPHTGAPEMLWLLVRADDGRTILADLGPRSYISAQNFYVVRGDRLRMTGSEVTTASGKHLFLPTDVTYGSHALRLRSASGTPLWEEQAAGAAATPGPTTSQTPPRHPSTTSESTSSTSGAAHEPNEPSGL